MLSGEWRWRLEGKEWKVANENGKIMSEKLRKKIGGQRVKSIERRGQNGEWRVGWGDWKIDCEKYNMKNREGK